VDPRTWLVVPFANVTRDPDIAWLGDAAVNLLYLDLSRWTDIRVVDDGRVADAVRTLPAGERETIGLNTGLGLARRLGAGRLVMGDLVKSGARTTVLAKVYDVTSGRRLRTVREEFTSRETTLPAFERLAGKVLDAALPAGTTRDAVGTTSLDAFQEYAAGTRALRAWELDSARARFQRAIHHDSTFALAHYRLSITIGWSVGAGQAIVAPAEAAARFAAGLPARERGLIRGQEQFVHNRYPEACETFRALVAADSLDVEAWYQLGECGFHDEQWVPVTADSMQWRPRADKTAAYRAFLRTLTLDPEMHLAYEHLIDMLRSQAGSVRWCMDSECRVLAERRLEVHGDSIATVAVRRERQQPPLPADTANDRANLAAAAAIAQRWLAAAPNESEAHFQHSLVLTGQRRFTEAASEIAAARRLGLRAQPGGPPAMQQVLALLKADSLNRRTLPHAIAIGDSILRGRIPLQFFGANPSVQAYAESTAIASLAGTMGIPSRVPERIPIPSWWRPSQGLVPTGLYRAAVHLAAGMASADLDAALAVLGDTAVTAGLRNASLRQGGPLCLGVCRLPTALIADSAWRASPMARALAGDTPDARLALRTLDSSIAANEVWGPPALNTLLGLALMRLAVRDTTAAIDALLRADRGRWNTFGGFGYGWALIPTETWQWGRTWLLTGDLLAATGRGEEAALFYRRVADLWIHADPGIQRLRQRAYDALPGHMR
jgi:TolB-like protein